MSEPRRALITGITGQDGSYLAELLLSKGYEVHGVVRRSSTFSTDRIDHLYHDIHVGGPNLELHYGDVLDITSLQNVLAAVEPDEVYHLAAQSHVAISFEMPQFTAEVTGVGALNMLEAIRLTGRPVRFYQAGSSEMYGHTTEPMQNENSPFRPLSPYAVSKVFAHHLTMQYRDAHGLFCANGILFNHESPRRGELFVTRKVTRGIAAILAGTQDSLYLGNLAAARDWGYAPEYVEAMWRILQHDEPDDFVIATGETHTVQEFVELAFSQVGLDWREHVEHDGRYDRPLDVPYLCGDATKARQTLEWSPTTRFTELVRLMLEADLRAVGIDPAQVMTREVTG